MRVVVDIPDREWAQLVNRAEEHNLRISELLRAAIEEAVPAERPLKIRILELVAAGYPDAVIAHHVGVTNRAVSDARRKAGLPANPLHRGGNNERKAS